MDSNQNNETGKPATDDVANEQNILPTDIPPPASLENQSPPAEITPSQTQPPMEVHHHTHTARKKWNHYLWEFLMLFLAVFCGFLAEYQLEHTIEHQREKEYAGTLYEDLKADTSILAAAINERNFVLPKIDSFGQLVHTKAIGEIPSGTWYYYGRFGTRNPLVAVQDATLQQLISSGGLRYFRRPNVAYAISQYDQLLREMKTSFAFQDLLYNELVMARNVIFDAWYFDEIMGLTVSKEEIDSFKQKSLPLLSTKQEDFKQYANLCQLRSFNLKSSLVRMEKAAERAKNLLALLKKEYHLK